MHLFEEAFGCGLLGLLALLNAWTVFTDGPLGRRFATAAVLSFLPLTILVRSVHAASTDEIDGLTLWLVLSQRWLTVSVVLLLGLILQSIFRWRVFLQRDASDRPQLERVSLRQWCLCTTSLAIGIGLFKNCLPQPAEPGQINAAWNAMLALTVAELGVTIVFLIGPILLSFAARWMRTLLPIGVALAGVVFTTWTFYVAQRDGSTAAVSSTGFISFFTVLVLGISFARRWGFRLGHVKREDLWDTQGSSAGHRWSGWAILGLLLMATLGLHLLASPAALVHAMSRSHPDLTAARVWKFACIAKSIDGISGVPAGMQTSSTSQGTLAAASWKDALENSEPRHEFSVMNSWMSLDVEGCGEIDKLARAVSAVEFIDITVASPSIGSGVLDCFAQRKEIGLLRIGAETIDEGAFDRLCRTTKMPRVFFTETPSLANIQSLRQVEGLTSVRIWNRNVQRTLIQFPSETARELGGLPVERLVIGFEDTKRLDLSQFASLRSISILASPLDKHVVDELNRLAESAGSIRYLSLIDCQFGEPVLQQLAKLRVESLSVHGRNAKALRAQQWRLLGACQSLKRLEVRSYNSDLRWSNTQDLLEDPIRRAQINVAANRQLLPMPWQSKAELAQRISQRPHKFTEVIQDAAHSHHKDNEGNLIQLDLNWIALDASVYDRLAEVESLVQLRMSTPFTRESFGTSDHSAVNQLWQNQNLSIVEFPSSFPVSDTTLQGIAKLPNLKRLVLPSLREIPNPDVVPFPAHLIEATTLQFQMKKAAQRTGEFRKPKATYDAHQQLTSRGVQALAAASSLDSLVLPGHMLASETLAVCESLPKLSELHFVLSEATMPQLRRISKLANLKELTIGVRGQQVSEAALVLREATRLDMLQLFVYDDGIYADATARRRMTEQLETSLPSVRVHLIPCPAF